MIRHRIFIRRGIGVPLPKKSGTITRYFPDMYGIVFVNASDEPTPGCNNMIGSPLPSIR